MEKNKLYLQKRKGDNEEVICYAKLKKTLNLKRIDEKRLIKAINQAQDFHYKMALKSKSEFYQDNLKDFNYKFHYLLKKEMFNPVHFPFSDDLEYLVIGDDEGRSIVLANFVNPKNITVADIDNRIPLEIKGKFFKDINTEIVDTRLSRNKVSKKYDVVISYSLLNSSLTTLIDFWKAKVKNCGIVYFSYYPALQKSFEDEIKIFKFIVERGGFEITHRTPYLIRMIKRI